MISAAAKKPRPVGGEYHSKSPANIFIAGEYACLYGMPALVLAPNRFTSAICHTFESFELQADFGQLGKFECNLGKIEEYLKNSSQFIPPLLIMLNLIKFFSSQANRSKTNGVSITVTTDFPIGSGMSSSTAFLVALGASLAANYGIELTHEELKSILMPYQNMLHGTQASGIEFASSIYGGVNFVRKSEVPMSIAGSPPCICVGNSGVSRTTNKAIGQVQLTESSIKDLGLLTTKAVKAWRETDWAEVGKCMVDVHEILKDAGASLDLLDKMVSATLSAGAWGAKLSGAGRGGVMVAIGPKEAEEKIITALKETGAKEAFSVKVASGYEIKTESTLS